MLKNSSKAWKALMNSSMRTATLAARSWGSVIQRSNRQPEAPSRAAASYVSRGIWLRPAMNKIM